MLGLKTGMPSIKVVPEGDGSRRSPTTQVQAAFGAGAPGALQIVAPRPTPRRSPRPRRPTPASRGSCPPQPGRATAALVQVVPKADPSDHGRRRDDRPPARRAARRRAGRRRGRREPRPRAGAVGEDAAGRSAWCSRSASCSCSSRCRRRSSPRSASSPTCSRSGAAFGVARLIFQDGHGAGLLGLRAAGLPRRLGAGVLLRDGLRHLDGLHGVPAVLRQGALGPQRTTRSEAMVGGVAHSGRVDVRRRRR